LKGIRPVFDGLWRNPCLAAASDASQRRRSPASSINPWPRPIAGVFGIAAVTWPFLKPPPGDLFTFAAKPIHEAPAAVELRRVPQRFGRVLRHLYGPHLHFLLLSKAASELLDPVVHGQDEIQLFVERQIAHQLVFAVYDLGIGLRWL